MTPSVPQIRDALAGDGSVSAPPAEAIARQEPVRRPSGLIRPALALNSCLGQPREALMELNLSDAYPPV